ncbi:MAG: hypothetical protein CSB55_00625 [Candidatus Cloacimonadota bacterium]|nr:MAG: hypothetical protein CSB55_00625 [Candidatus Cloacimonadota bacterium]
MIRSKYFYAFLIFILAAFVVSTIFIFTKKEKEKAIKSDSGKNLSPIQIILLNGTGETGLAGKIRGILAEGSDIDVISCANANKFIYDKSIIVVRKDTIGLRRLKIITGIERRVFAKDKNAHAQFDVILGNDYEKYFR